MKISHKSLLATIIALAFLLDCYPKKLPSADETDYASPRRLATTKLQIFPGPETVNIQSDCILAKTPICCGLLMNQTTASKSNTVPYPRQDYVTHDIRNHHHNSHPNCTFHREYIPSAYEEKHIRWASEFNSHANIAVRAEHVVRRIMEDMDDAAIWLARVKVHMTADPMKPINATKEDYEYLSRFIVTKTCAHRSESWEEWIEPLTIHARHPYSIIPCILDNRIPKYYPNLSKLRYSESFKNLSKFQVTQFDYIITQSNLNLKRGAVYSDDNHLYTTHPKHYLFDAGTSTFLSSLSLFLCAYLQVSINCY